MRQVHYNLKSKSFTMPSNIQKATICADSGLLANKNCKKQYVEYFLKGTAPTTYCNK